MHSIAYTAEEIEKQIWEFEHIKVQIPDRTATFNKRWQDVFKEPLKGDQNVDDFNDRFNLFAMSCV